MLCKYFILLTFTQNTFLFIDCTRNVCRPELNHHIVYLFSVFPKRPFIISNGIGKTIVEFFSCAILFSVCKYRSCNAAPDCEITSDASFNDWDAFFSPSAAIIFARAAQTNNWNFNLKKVQLGRINEHWIYLPGLPQLQQPSNAAIVLAGWRLF